MSRRQLWQLVGSPQRLPYYGQVGLLAAVYFITAKASLVLAIPPGYATAVWPASGIALAAMLLFGTRLWPGVWLGATLAHLTVAFLPLPAVLIGAGQTLEVVVGATLIRRYVGVPRRFERGRDVILFVAVSAVSCTIAATVGVSSLAAAGAVSRPEFPANWWTWWQGDLAGIIVAAPLVLSWSLRRAARWSHQKKLEAVCFGLLLLVFTLLVFGDATGLLAPFPLTFSILPFMIWAALCFSQRVVTTAIAAVCAFAVHYTVDGVGPFVLWSLNESLLILLAFISTIAVTSLVLSAVLTERRRAMDDLERALAGLREQAITDPLTGLYNRRYLWEFLQREWIRAKRRGSSVAVIMIDLDFFKRINDTHGHDAGDFVLVAVAAALRTHIRSSDIACRYGGEEFALILPEATATGVRRRAEDIRATIRRQDLRHHGTALGRITVSIGVALFPDHAHDPDSLLRAADAALYQAKSAGRDRTVIGPPQHPSPARSVLPDRAAAGSRRAPRKGGPGTE